MSAFEDCAFVRLKNILGVINNDGFFFNLKQIKEHVDNFYLKFCYASNEQWCVIVFVIKNECEWPIENEIFYQFT